MKIKSNLLAIITIGILFGSFFITDALGYWQTESKKIPAKFETGDYEGQANPADIRGSFSFGDIESAFNIPVARLAEAFDVTAEEALTFQVKNLEARYAELAETGREIGTNSVRYFVALYNNLPFEAAEAVYIPAQALEVLWADEKITEDQATLLRPVAITLPDLTGIVVPAAEQSPSNVSEAEGFILKGKTTFKELIDAGAMQTDIEKILGEQMPSPLTVIKTFCTEKGLDFETIKIQLNDLAEGQS